MAASIAGVDEYLGTDEVAKVIATDLTPRIIQYRNDMAAIRDELFSDIIKMIAVWEVPSLSLAYLTNLGLAGAIAVFASALAPAATHVRREKL